MYEQLFAFTVVYLTVIPFVAGVAAFVEEADGSPEKNLRICCFSLLWPLVFLAIPILLVMVVVGLPVSAWQVWKNRKLSTNEAGETEDSCE